jgi:hypothetical protein
VLHLLPKASAEEQHIAQKNVDTFVAVICKIADRLVREEEIQNSHAPETRGRGDVVGKPDSPQQTSLFPEL